MDAPEIQRHNEAALARKRAIERDVLGATPAGTTVHYATERYVGTAPLSAWRSGPLPDPALEAIARKLFERQFPTIEWTSNLFRLEQDDARNFARQLAADFAARDRWTPADAAERLADETQRIVFGERRLGRTLRGEIAAIAESYVADLWITFRHRLLRAVDIEANQQEVNEEANRSRVASCAGEQQ